MFFRNDDYICITKHKHISVMKRLILALLTAGSIATTANAQEPKSILWYGDINLHTVRDSVNTTTGNAGRVQKTTNWNITTGVGYQFNRNWTLGMMLSWGQDATKTVNAQHTTDNMYKVGPFARYSRYIGRSETFFWFTQLDFTYQGGYTTHEGDPAYNKHNGIYVGFYPALGVNMGRAVCLNFNIGGMNYATDKYTTAVYSINTFNLNFGRQVNIGISKNFNTGHKMHSHHEPGDEVHHRKMDKDDDDDSAPKPKKKERSRDDDE